MNILKHATYIHRGSEFGVYQKFFCIFLWDTNSTSLWCNIMSKAKNCPLGTGLIIMWFVNVYSSAIFSCSEFLLRLQYWKKSRLFDTPLLYAGQRVGTEGYLLWCTRWYLQWRYSGEEGKLFCFQVWLLGHWDIWICLPTSLVCLIICNR